MTFSPWKHMLLALSVCAGCSAAQPSVTDDSSSAITHAQAAEDLSLSEIVVRDEPVSTQRVADLGVTQWSVYVRVDAEFSGTVAFATDAERDVRYALVVDVTDNREDGEGRAVLLEYEKDGSKRAASTIARDVLEALTLEVAVLGEKMAASSEAGLGARALGNGTECGLRVAVIALATVAGVSAGGWMPASLAAAHAAGAISGAAATATVLSVDVAVAGAVAGILMSQWDKTVKRCRAAFAKER